MIPYLDHKDFNLVSSLSLDANSFPYLQISTRLELSRAPSQTHHTFVSVEKYFSTENLQIDSKNFDKIAKTYLSNPDVSFYKIYISEELIKMLKECDNPLRFVPKIYHYVGTRLKREYVGVDDDFIKNITVLNDGTPV